MQNSAVISKIYIYPIKSLPGIELKHAIVSHNGVVHPDNLNVIDRYTKFEKGKAKIII